MKLKNLDKFYQEVQSLKLNSQQTEDRLSNTLSLSHYADHYYNAELEKLGERALSVILTFPTEQIQNNINRLQYINERLSRCHDFLKTAFDESKNGQFKLVSFLSDINLFFFSLNIRIPERMDFIIIQKEIIRMNINANADHEFNFSVENSEDFLTDFHSAVEAKSTNVNFLIFKIKTFTGIEPQLYGGSVTDREKEAEDIKKGSNLTKPQLKSYTWTGLMEDLKEFYSYVIDNLIVDTEENDFIAAFSGQPIDNINPIKWHEDNATEVLYFVRCMMNAELITDERKRMNYQRLIGCIVKPDGSLFDSDSLKSLNQRIEIELSPSKKEMINTLITSLL